MGPPVQPTPKRSNSNPLATQQFYNFSNYEGNDRRPDAYGTSDNARFLWPSPINRNTITGDTFGLQRGYMRMITEGYGDQALGSKLKHKRFHFQFNPDVLVRSVTARNDVQFWMNQDPGQLVSPIPGDANFAFEFILNREQEMATGRTWAGTVVAPNSVPKTAPLPKGRGGQPAPVPVPAAIPTFDSTVPLASRTPNIIGVLADLLVFDSIIGQGINSDLMEIISTQYKKNVKSSQNATKDANGQKTEDDEDYITPAQENLGALDKTLKLSLGNSAFLISQPVRILFSSLFMVEGFISSTTVTFNKFNQAMVPTQCTVSVSMQAMYIGFAEKDTFLTTTLRDASLAIDEDEVVTDEDQVLLSTITPFEYLGGMKQGKLDNDEVGPDRFIPTKANADFANLQWAVVRTKECTSAMEDGHITGFTANLTMYIYYVSHPDGDDPDNYYATHKDEVVYTTSASTTYKDFDTGHLWNPLRIRQKLGDANTGFSWDITRATPQISRAWDDRDNAKYRVQIAISIDIESSYTSVTSDQWWTMDEVRNYNSDFNTASFKPVIGKPSWHKN